jgi:hypothetical protein
MSFRIESKIALEEGKKEFVHHPLRGGQEHILKANWVFFGTTPHVFGLRVLLSAVPNLFLTLGYLIAAFSKVDFTDLHGPLVKFLGRFVIPQSLTGITQNQKSDRHIGMLMAQRTLLHGQSL